MIRGELKCEKHLGKGSSNMFVAKRLVVELLEFFETVGVSMVVAERGQLFRPYRAWEIRADVNLGRWPRLRYGGLSAQRHWLDCWGQIQSNPSGSNLIRPKPGSEIRGDVLYAALARVVARKIFWSDIRKSTTTFGKMMVNIDKEYCDALNTMATPGGASHDKIETAEKELGVAFPASYRQFLAKYGAGMGTGFELAGIFEDSNRKEPPMWRRVVLLTKQLRRVSRGAIPNHLIPVSDDGQGTTFYIDTKSEAARVVAYGPGLDGQIVATSFKEFVVKAVRGQL